MALRLGMDLVAVSAVAQSLRGEHRERYLTRVYTEREVDDCRGPSGRVEPERLAARFAAKEATLKALPGAGEEVRLTQIEVVQADDGSVSLRLTDRAAQLFDDSDGTEIALSLSHEGGLAAATVVIT